MQAARGASLNDAEEPRPATVTPSKTAARVIVVSLAVVLLAVDQLTKVWAVATQDPGVSEPFVGEVLQFTLVRNPGAAFGAGTSLTELISVLAIVATLAACWFAWRTSSRGWAVALGFLIAGVGGNLIDRIVREPGNFGGHVIDFLQLPNWPVFNVADICINIAAVLILLLAWRGIGLDGSRAERT